MEREGASRDGVETQSLIILTKDLIKLRVNFNRNFIVDVKEKENIINLRSKIVNNKGWVKDTAGRDRVGTRSVWGFPLVLPE